MMNGSLWLTKLILAHLLTDFVLQPSQWVKDRNERHFASAKLYLHGLVTALVAWAMIGWYYWPVALVILVTHTAIDGWKSYQERNARYFIIDQLLHLAVIAGCWYFTFDGGSVIHLYWQQLNNDPHAWIVIAAFVFITTPAGILIGQLTKQWSQKISDVEKSSLVNAGKWIGIAERIIVLILVLQNQYSAIGLLVTAKGIIRFSEKDRPEVKTEYLVIGTLLSIGTAIIAGVLTKI
ncbi:MAG TPA: DUF3307 domain-containing protein [Puia sp.]|nr:DUF3307 domain-containing protein [Puia sp.]